MTIEPRGITDLLEGRGRLPALSLVTRLRELDQHPARRARMDELHPAAAGAARGGRAEHLEAAGAEARVVGRPGRRS